MNRKIMPLGAETCARCVIWVAVTASLFALSHVSAAAPDVELGRYLANQCLTCHRNGNVGGIAIPNIFGTPEPHLITMIKAYRDKTITNEVMQSQAAGLKDDEIEALAAYFARAKRP